MLKKIVFACAFTIFSLKVSFWLNWNLMCFFSNGFLCAISLLVAYFKCVLSRTIYLSDYGTIENRELIKRGLQLKLFGRESFFCLRRNFSTSLHLKEGKSRSHRHMFLNAFLKEPLNYPWIVKVYFYIENESFKKKIVIFSCENNNYWFFDEMNIIINDVIKKCKG